MRLVGTIVAMTIAGVLLCTASKATEVADVSFSRDNKSLVVSFSDKNAEIYNIQTGEKESTLPAVSNRAIFDRSGGRVYLATHSNILVYYVDNQRVVKLPGSKGAAYGLEVSRDGSFVVAVGDDGVARAWDVKYNSRMFPIRTTRQKARSITIDPNGRYIYVGTEGGFVGTYFSDLGKRKWRDRRALPGKRLSITSIHKLPGHRPLLVGGPVDGGFYFASYDPKTMTPKQVATPEIKGVRTVVSKTLIASCHGDVTLTETSQFKRIHVFPVEHKCRSVALSSSGKLLAVGDAGGAVTLYDTSTFKRLRYLE